MSEVGWGEGNQQRGGQPARWVTPKPKGSHWDHRPKHGDEDVPAPIRWLGLWKVVAVVLVFQVTPGLAQRVAAVEKTLSNGMRLLMVERHDEPSVAGGGVAHVGSANERPGMTGIAHLFEHMMFKGTPTIGTTNYDKDLVIISSQEQVREAMRREEQTMRAAYRRGEIDDLLKPENKTARYRELEQQFQKLIADQRAVLVKNEFDRIYSGEGSFGDELRSLRRT